MFVCTKCGSPCFDIFRSKDRKIIFCCGVVRKTEIRENGQITVLSGNCGEFFDVPPWYMMVPTNRRRAPSLK